MFKKLTSVLCIICMLCTMVPAMVAFADTTPVTTASDYFKDNVVGTDYQTTFSGNGTTTFTTNADNSITFSVIGNGTTQARNGVNDTWINTGYAEATFDYQFTGTIPTGATYTQQINLHIGAWFNGHMLNTDGNKYTVKAVIDINNLDADGKMYVVYYEKPYGADDSQYVQKANPCSTKPSTFDSLEPHWKIVTSGYPDGTTYNGMTIDNFDIVEKCALNIRNFEGGIYTTEDTVDVDFYLPAGYTTASLSVGGNVIATYDPDTYAAGCWKTAVDLSNYAGKNIPVVLSCTDSAGTKSVSTSIGEVILSKINKEVYTDDFSSTATFADGATTATSYSGISGITLGADSDNKSTMSIVKESIFNNDPVFKYDITDGTAAQKQFMCSVGKNVYGDGYCSEVEYDIYATNNNYILCYLVKNTDSSWPGSDWKQISVNMTANEWHNVKCRLYNDRELVYVYVDGVLTTTLERPGVTGFNEIGFGLRATGTAANTCTVYIDNFKVSAWAPVCQDLAATMDTDAKTVTASLKTGADVAAENVCAIIIATYNGDDFAECKVYPVVSEAQELITFNQTFNATKEFTTAKVMVWDSVSGLKPLAEFAPATATE